MFLETEVTRDSRLAFHLDLVKDQLRLLDRQVAIENQDSSASGDTFVRFPPPSVLATSISQTLYYCTFYHWDDSESRVSSPIGMKKAHNISDKKFLHLAIRSFARQGKWNRVEELSISKGYFSSKPKSVIGWEPFVDAVFSENGPRALALKFIGYIEDPVKRFEVLTGHHLYEEAVQLALGLKKEQGGPLLSKLLTLLCRIQEYRRNVGFPPHPEIDRLKRGIELALGK